MALPIIGAATDSYSLALIIFIWWYCMLGCNILVAGVGYDDWCSEISKNDAPGTLASGGKFVYRFWYADAESLYY